MNLSYSRQLNYSILQLALHNHYSLTSYLCKKFGMAINKEAYAELMNELKNKKVNVVAVSKTKTAEDIFELYKLGQIDFGENYGQELLEKYPKLPADIRWHFIGHMQTNKVKQIVPFIYLIHSIDSYKLLSEINKQALKNNRVINCLLQVHIAEEETKFGFDEKELDETINELANAQMKNINVVGLMGMASFTEDLDKVRSEFKYLKSIFDKYKTSNFQSSSFNLLSMGMSNDYRIAIEEGSNMIRIGSLLFGERV
jgi:PLP dependent protein